MGKKQYPEPFLRGKYYYFTYTDPQTGKRKNISTGLPKGKKEEAREYIREFISKLDYTEKTFREYAAPYFIWDTCPHVQRKLKTGETIGTKHVNNSRRNLEVYVFPDVFSTLNMREIRRAHILDLQDRVNKKAGPAVVNKVMNAVKVIFSEAYYREDIENNPGAKVGAIKYNQEKKDILSQNDLSFLFSDIPGIWEDILTYCVFNLTAQTGMRCGEVLALTWQAINFQESVIDIFQAWKTRNTLGLPKWNKKRTIPVTHGVIESLLQLKEESIRLKPEDLIFSYENSGIPSHLWPGENRLYDIGQRLGGTWWTKNFKKAMQKAGIDTQHINLTPHSLRHSLNTHLLNAGCDPLKVQVFFGWSPNIRTPILTTVQKGYTHFQAEHLRELVPVIEGIFQKE